MDYYVDYHIDEVRANGIDVEARGRQRHRRAAAQVDAFDRDELEVAVSARADRNDSTPAIIARP